MPRLTNPDYIKLHHALARHWHHDNFVYGTLSPNEQWDLHAYFLPYKTLTNEELLQHRKTITKQHPSLPHKAGRAFHHLDRNIEQIRERQAQEEERGTQAQASPTKSRYRISPKVHTPEPVQVHALVNPEINVDQLARAFISLARQQLKEQKEGSKSKIQNDV